MNLRHVPEAERPPQEALEVDYDPWEGVEWPADERPGRRRQPPRSEPQEGGDSPS